MNFTFTWIMDKLGYMPKIDMEIGKIKSENAQWPFPEGKITSLSKPLEFPVEKKKRPYVRKATTRTVSKKTDSKKAK